VLAAGLMSGLVVGGGLAFIMELRDRGIHSDVDLQHYLPVPVLAVMPVIHTAESWAELRQSRRRKWTISAVAVGACCLLLAALMVRGTIDLANWI